MTINLALVGCGGMGLRHAHGYVELFRHFPGAVRMAAVCDRHESAAERVADEVEQGTGKRPRVHTDFRQMLDEEHELDALDVVTDTRMHHGFAIEAIESGRHVMTEKPMGLTLRACRLMRDAAESGGRILAVAENFRRDPMNRLTRALLESGAIGRPYFAVDTALSGGSGGVMHNTAWRARKDRAGGVVLDAGVHNADLLIYLMGGVSSVYAETAVFERNRQQVAMADLSPNLAQFYSHRIETDAAPEEAVEQDAVDTAFAVLRFESGAIGQLSMSDVSHGHAVGVSTIHGSLGTLLRSPSRSGKGPELRLQGETVSGDDLLSLVPEFELDDVTAALWGGQRRMSSYDLPFDAIDRKIIAIEYMDFARAIETGRPPEVDAAVAMNALALAYGVMESGEAGAPVSLDEVISGAVESYQRDINEAVGL
ncbi:MAG: Gfo/Idh/MocA family oxidoreductase [Dehalococcoidia bacterium]